MNVLVFEVGSFRYALPALQVREILRAVTVVPLPRAPRIIEGLINVHGDVVPVLDIRSRFRLPPKALSVTDHLVVAWAEHRLVAIRADRVDELVQIESGDIEDPKTLLTRVEYVAGVARLADGLLFIHDLRTFLDQAEAAALDDAMLTTAVPERTT